MKTHVASEFGEELAALDRSAPRNSWSDGERSLDEVFSVLSNCRRRHIIHYLKSVGRPVALRELTEQIAAWENGVDNSETTYGQRKRIYVSLRQTHLPKMAKMGFVEFDAERGHISLKDRIEELDLYLEVTAEDEVPWSGLYLGLSVLAGIGLSVATLGLFPLSLVSPIWYALGTVTLFGLVAIVHLRQTMQMRLGSHGKPPSLR